MLVESFSGIRGIYGESLTEELAEKYAQSFLHWQKNIQGAATPQLVVGRDTRPSSHGLAAAFIKEFVAAGVEVFDVGVASTPAIENTVRYLEADGGVIITGSHNSPEWNGWKLLRPDGAILSASDAEQVINYVHEGKNDAIGNTTGTVIDKTTESRQAYNDLLVRIVGPEWLTAIKDKRFKILFDAGGGAAIPHFKDMAETFGIDAKYQNAELGEFKRLIEPTVDSLRYLVPIAQAQKVEFAVGFDGDADRAEIVLPNGEMVSGQYVLAVIVDEILSGMSSTETQMVVINDATSDLIAEIAQKYRAKVKAVEVGEINLVDAMQALGSVVGGEGSNGGCIVAPTTCRDGLLATLIIARHLARTNQSLSETLGSYPKFYTLNKKLSLPGKIYNRDEIEKLFAHEPDVVVSKTGDATGGIKIRYSDNAWLWFRGSKTEAGVVRVYAESKDEARAQMLLEKGRALLGVRFI